MLTWIGHVRYINILTWLWGFWVKIVNFSSFLCPSNPKRDLDTKNTAPNIEVCPENIVAMLEYWYIQCGLLMHNNLQTFTIQDYLLSYNAWGKKYLITDKIVTQYTQHQWKNFNLHPYFFIWHFLWEFRSTVFGLLNQSCSLWQRK